MMHTLAGFVLLSLMVPAAPMTLTFEGLGDGIPVADFYSSAGLSFIGATAFIDSDNGGTGDFGGEPSPSTAAFSLTGMIVNSHAGLIGAVSFYYANPFGTTNVRLFSGENLTGDLISDVFLNTTPAGGSPDPTGLFGPFEFSSAEFQAVARSFIIVSRGPGGLFADNLTVTSVPEPKTLCLWTAVVPFLLRAAVRRRPRRFSPNRVQCCNESL
jgi:hypothetical protein